MTQPAPESLTLPVEVRFIADAEQGLGPAETYTPETWRQRVDIVRALLARDGQPVCPIGCEPIPPEHARKWEHVVPQAVGVKWVKLPPGVVDDRVNHALSDCELDLFRTGTTAFLRPMYDTGNAEVPFDAGAGRTVTMAHHHERGCELHLRDGEKPTGEPPDESGPGEFHVSALVRQPRPDLTSRALCKAAYLMLVVHSPELALRDEFAPLREWLLNRKEGDRRPYGEKPVAGAPGAQFKFLVGCEADGERVTALRWAVAMVRFGAVAYHVALLGEPPGFDGMLDRDPDIHRFEDTKFDGRERRMTFTFGFDGIRRMEP
ncbi:MAG: hypothetical protein Q8P18_24925 [Pseudomonadota bacterium]|nr:hypothetical protein [Pseudomonadota bacterium]